MKTFQPIALLVLLLAVATAEQAGFRSPLLIQSSAGFCSWGPDGAGASSTCSSGRQGGSWCNESSENCGQCGGRWCSNDETSDPSFLKEIIQGRCYFSVANAVACPDIVGSIMSVLENHRDADISTSTFDRYIQYTSFNSPPDHALFWLSFLGTYKNDGEYNEWKRHVTKPASLVTPEDTPGGFLLKDLLFCGVDQRENCSIENSNAYWKFWEAAYGEFASRVSGRVQIVVEPLADVSFLQRSAIANLNADKVTFVTLYANDCLSQSVVFLVSALEQQHFSADIVYCSSDIVEFILCQDPASPVCTGYLLGNRGNDGITDSTGSGTFFDPPQDEDMSVNVDPHTIDTKPLPNDGTDNIQMNISQEEENAANDDSSLSHYQKHHHTRSTFFVFVAILGVIGLYLTFSNRTVMIEYEIIHDNPNK